MDNYDDLLNFVDRSIESEEYAPTSRYDEMLKTIDATIEGPEEQGLAKTIGKGLVRGLEQMGMGLSAGSTWAFELAEQLPWVGDVIRETDITEKTEEFTKWWEKQIQEGWAAPDERIWKGSFFENPSARRVAGIIAEAAPTLAAALTAGWFLTPALGVAGATAAATAMLSATEVGPMYREARQAGKGVGESTIYGGVAGVATYYLERWPIGRFLGMGEKLGKGLLKDAWGGFWREGLQEVSQEFVQNAVAKLGYDDTRALTSGLIEAFIGGGGTGAIAGGTFGKLQALGEKYGNDPDFEKIVDQGKEVIQATAEDTAAGLEAQKTEEAAPPPEVAGIATDAARGDKPVTTIKDEAEQKGVRSEDADQAIIEGIASRPEGPLPPTTEARPAELPGPTAEDLLAEFDALVAERAKTAEEEGEATPSGLWGVTKVEGEGYRWETPEGKTGIVRFDEFEENIQLGTIEERAMAVARRIAQGIDPIPEESPEIEPEKPLKTPFEIPEGVRVIRSGASNISDLEGIMRTQESPGVTILDAVGKSALSEKAQEKLVEAAADREVMVDSGTYQNYRARNFKKRADVQPYTDEQFQQIIDRYQEIVEQASQAENVLLVAPDEVGNQARTLELWEMFEEDMQNFLASGAKVLVPIQVFTGEEAGDLSPIEVWNRAKELFTPEDFGFADPKQLIPSFPASAEVVTDEQLLEFFQDAKVESGRVHFLGMGERSTKFMDRIQIVKTIRPTYEVTTDVRLYIHEVTPLRAEKVEETGEEWAEELAVTDLVYADLEAAGRYLGWEDEYGDFKTDFFQTDFNEEDIAVIDDKENLDAFELAYLREHPDPEGLGKILSARVMGIDWKTEKELLAGLAGKEGRIEARKAAVAEAHRQPTLGRWAKEADTSDTRYWFLDPHGPSLEGTLYPYSDFKGFIVQVGDNRFDWYPGGPEVEESGEVIEFKTLREAQLHAEEEFPYEAPEGTEIAEEYDPETGWEVRETPIPSRFPDQPSRERRLEFLREGKRMAVARTIFEGKHIVQLDAEDSISQHEANAVLAELERRGAEVGTVFGSQERFVEAMEFNGWEFVGVVDDVGTDSLLEFKKQEKVDTHELEKPLVREEQGVKVVYTPTVEVKRKITKTTKPGYMTDGKMHFDGNKQKYQLKKFLEIGKKRYVWFSELGGYGSEVFDAYEVVNPNQYEGQTYDLNDMPYSTYEGAKLKYRGNTYVLTNRQIIATEKGSKKWQELQQKEKQDAQDNLKEAKEIRKKIQKDENYRPEYYRRGQGQWEEDIATIERYGLWDVTSKDLPNLMAERLLWLAYHSNPLRYLGITVTKGEVQAEIERRGLKFLQDLGWPSNLDAEYRNKHTGSVQPLAHFLDVKRRYYYRLDEGVAPEFINPAQITMMLSDWEPNIGLNKPLVDYTTKQLEQARNDLKLKEDLKKGLKGWLPEAIKGTATIKRRIQGKDVDVEVEGEIYGPFIIFKEETVSKQYNVSHRATGLRISNQNKAESKYLVSRLLKADLNWNFDDAKNAPKETMEGGAKIVAEVREGLDFRKNLAKMTYKDIHKRINDAEEIIRREHDRVGKKPPTYTPIAEDLIEQFDSQVEEVQETKKKAEKIEIPQTVKELQAALKELGVPHTGPKGELQVRYRDELALRESKDPIGEKHPYTAWQRELTRRFVENKPKNFVLADGKTAPVLWFDSYEAMAKTMKEGNWTQIRALNPYMLTEEYQKHHPFDKPEDSYGRYYVKEISDYRKEGFTDFRYVTMEVRPGRRVVYFQAKKPGATKAEPSLAVQKATKPPEGVEKIPRPTTAKRDRISNGINRINELLKKPKKLSLKLSIDVDEDVYPQIKGILDEMWVAAQEEGLDHKGFVGRVVADLGAPARPYFKRWAYETFQPKTEDTERTQTSGLRRRPGRRPEPTGPIGTEGVQRSRREPTQQLRVAGRELLPTPPDRLPPERYTILDEAQRQAANLALDAYSRGKPGFMLADGSGVGKTMTELVTAAEWAKISGKPTLIVTPNQNIINTRYRVDAKLIELDIDASNIEMTTYFQIAAKKGGQGNYGLVIFDEAHNLKNMQAKKTAAAEDVRSDHTMYATATPMDQPHGASYFLSAITGVSQAEIQRKLGYRVNEFVRPDGSIGRVPALLEGYSWATVYKNIMQMRNQAVQDGTYVRREYPFYGKIEIEELPDDPDYNANHDAIWDYWERIIRSSWGKYKRNMAGQRVLEMARWTETTKPKKVWPYVLRDIEAGKKVVIVAEYINETTIKGLGATVEGTIKQLEALAKAAGIKVARIYGGGKLDKEIAKFQEGEAVLALMTPTSGGVGVDLDDFIGDKPRSMYLLGSGWAGDLTQQVLFRISRRNTRSPGHIRLLMQPNSFSDNRRQNKVHKKLQTLIAIQEGTDLDEAVGFEVDNVNVLVKEARDYWPPEWQEAVDIGMGQRYKMSLVKVPHVVPFRDRTSRILSKFKLKPNQITVFEISVPDDVAAKLQEGAEGKKAYRPQIEFKNWEQAWNWTTNSQRKEDWMTYYNDVVQPLAEKGNWMHIRKVTTESTGGKVVNLGVVRLCVGCGRPVTIVEYIYSGIVAPNTPVECCYASEEGVFCWTIKTAGATRWNTVEPMDARNIEIASPEQIEAFVKSEAGKNHLTNTPFIREGYDGCSSHLFATDRAEIFEWLKKRHGIDAPTIYISASYGPVTMEDYERMQPYADRFKIHFTVSGWFDKNQNMIRMANFLAAREAGLDVVMRVVTNRDNVGKVAMPNQEWLFDQFVQNNVRQGELLQTPVHIDNKKRTVKVEGIETWNPEWRSTPEPEIVNVCCQHFEIPRNVLKKECVHCKRLCMTGNVLAEGKKFKYSADIVGAPLGTSIRAEEASDLRTRWENQAVKYFGTTDLVAEAGFILEDGQMLDFTGKTEEAAGEEPAIRYFDHFDISEAMDDDTPNDGSAIYEFIKKTGAVRVSMVGDMVMLDLAHFPSPFQWKQIAKAVKQSQAVYLDIADFKTDRIHGRSFQGGKAAMGDIRRFVEDYYGVDDNRPRMKYAVLDARSKFMQRKVEIVRQKLAAMDTDWANEMLLRHNLGTPFYNEFVDQIHLLNEEKYGESKKLPEHLIKEEYIERFGKIMMQQVGNEWWGIGEKLITAERAAAYLEKVRKETGKVGLDLVYLHQEARMTSVNDKGVHFQTGVPVKFEACEVYEKGKSQQYRELMHLAPAGRMYAHSTSLKDRLFIRPDYSEYEELQRDGFIRDVGTIELRHPLVITHNTDNIRNTDQQYWVSNLSRSFGGLTGMDLTRELMRAGFDSVVTVANTMEPRVIDIVKLPFVVQPAMLEEQSTKEEFIDVKLEDIKAFFKHHKVTQGEEGIEIEIMRGKLKGQKGRITWVKYIAPDRIAIGLDLGRTPEEVERIATRARVRGIYIIGENEILLVRGLGNKWTLAHESHHWMEELGIIDRRDIAVLKETIQRLVRRGRFETVNPQDIGGEEDRANYTATMLNQKDLPKGVDAVFAKIREWIDRVVNRLGFRTAPAIIRDIESGAIWDERVAPTAFMTSLGMTPMLPSWAYGKKKVPAEIAELGGRTELNFAGKMIKATQDFSANWQTRAVDRFYPLKSFFGSYTVVKGKKRYTFPNAAYMLFRLETGMQGMLAMLMRHGKIELDESGLPIINEHKKGFQTWWKNLDKGVAERLPWYVAAKRAEMELEPDGRERWLTETEREKIYKWVYGLNPDEAYWKGLNDELQVWNKNILDFGQSCGLFSAEQRESWEQQFYVPFFRLFENAETRDELLDMPRTNRRAIDSGIRHLYGAEMKLGDPFENLIRSWTHILHEGVRNLGFAKAVELAEQMSIKTGAPPILQRIRASEMNKFFTPAGQKGKKRYTYVHKKTDLPVMGFMENGKRVWFVVHDSELFNAMSNINAVKMGRIMDIFRLPKRMLTYGATFTIPFRIANMLRDSIHTSILTRDFTPFWDSVRGAWAAARENMDYVRFMSSMGGFGSSYVRADDPQVLAKYLTKITQKEGKSALNRILNTPAKMLAAWDKVGAVSENAARTQLYANMRDQGFSHLEAAFYARDIMDFTMRGDHAAMQWLIQMIPFMNARLQGNYRMGRGMVENPGAVLAKGMMVAGVSLLLWGWNRNKKEWKELEDWDRWMYYHIWAGDLHYRIPKPFETGVLFSSAWETAAESIAGSEDMEYMGDFITFALSDVFSLMDWPQVAKPMFEQYANRVGFTGRPIVSDRLAGLTPSEQADPWNSEFVRWAAREMPEWLPDTMRSPKRIEHLIRGYTAGAGMFALWLADNTSRLWTRFPERPVRAIDDHPVFGRFAKRRHYPRHTKFETVFYDALNEVQRTIATITHYRKGAELQQAIELGRIDLKHLQLKRPVQRAAKTLRKISDNMRRVWRHPTMSAEDKRMRIDEMINRKNIILERMYEQLKDF